MGVHVFLISIVVYFVCWYGYVVGDVVVVVFVCMSRWLLLCVRAYA